MGVQNLWELLAPVGRRVSVETLSGKKLAIDASIWMIQFMKAMRDEKGEMVRNAHILGFFRRICKLLFLRTKPVFVFDGGTPALKRRTVIARRRQRENAQAKIRKTAEKLLLNHLKTMRLNELAKDLENQRQKNDAKGKRKITDKTYTAGATSDRTENVLGSYNQEALDEMLAASLAAEDNESLMHDASTSAASIPAEEEDSEEEEEMILPTMHGKVDPAVLAALPPSMQLDLLVQMRERLMAENRQKYQKVKKAPERFSELQIQAYLKTVAFRRDIDEVRKSAAGRGIGGVQTSRIASEANREYIFSSSFTGDKQAFTSAGLEGNSNGRQIPTVTPLGASGVPLPTKKPDVPESVVEESRKMSDDDVETYLDERGRLRVSRVRAMGFRMTRDLQRNLDLMKEIEQERSGTDKNTKSTVGTSRKLPSKIQLLETSDQGSDEIFCSNNQTGTSLEVTFDDNDEHRNVESDDDLFSHLVAGDSNMSFSADDNPLKKLSSDSDCEWEEGVVEGRDNTLNHDLKVGNKPSTSEGHEHHESEMEWEKGPVDIYAHASSLPSENKVIVTKDVSNDSEVEWEDGSTDVCGHASFYPPEYKETVSKGALEEEVNFQEAIRRSLEDSRCHKYIHASSKDVKLNKRVADNEGICQKKDWIESNVLIENVLQPNKSSSEVLAGVGILKHDDSPPIQLAPSVGVEPDKMEVLAYIDGNSYQNIHPEPGQDASVTGKLCEEIGCVESDTPTEGKGFDLIHEQIMGSSIWVGQVPKGTNCSPGSSSLISGPPSVGMQDVTFDKARQFDIEIPVHDHLKDTAEPIESIVRESTVDNYVAKRLANEENDDLVNVREEFTENIEDPNKEHIEVTEASLEEEMRNLDKERATLGDEQRKLERNAESVSSEMFMECQELLQMFGLPYIIAPMEAEAQCAYMELEKLVDGVVTDDSDVLLFGARSVYKNIFDDRKYVETYFMKDIENELGLTQEKLIRMALLLGSDYTEGVSGIGIVNAIEVINAFPEKDGLRKFREWIESPDPAILGKVDLKAGSSLRKRGSKLSEIGMSASNNNVEDGASSSDQHAPVDELHEMKQKFMDKHRNVSKNWHIPSTFPSEAVISAYESPQVDKSTESFSWGKPDLFVLRKLCWEKFGWDTQKADELLVPVLKEYSKHETQLRLEAFYTFNERFAKIRSKRIKKAVKGTMGNKALELMDDTVQEVSKSRKKRNVSSTEARSGEHACQSDGGVAKDEINSTVEPAARKTKNTRTHGERSVRGRGRGRGRSAGSGRGRGQSARRGKRKDRSGVDYAEISSDDGNGSDSVREPPAENYVGSHEVRRSTRPRKDVKYGMDDLDMDVSHKTNQNDESSADEDAGEEEILRDSGVVGASLSKRNYNEVENLFSVESLSKDRIEIEGGGICMGEDESEIGASQLNLDQIHDLAFEAGLSQEYLKIGGGFCLDDNEGDVDPGKSVPSQAREISNENDDPAHWSFLEEAENDISYDPSQSVSSPRQAVGELRDGGHTDTPDTGQNLGIPRVASTTHENHMKIANSHKKTEGDDSGATSVRFLSAMPNLRRKRRR